MVHTRGNIAIVSHKEKWHVYVNGSFIGVLKNNEYESRKLYIQESITLTRGDLKNLQILFNVSMGGNDGVS